MEWEQIDREKDKTVLSLNQTIAILQRDLTALLEEKEGTQYPNLTFILFSLLLVFIFLLKYYNNKPQPL